MSLLQPILDNFFKFDFLIILIAVFAWFIYWYCMKLSNELMTMLEPKGDLSQGKKTREQLNQHVDFYLGVDGERRITEKLKQVNQYYVIFINICAIFPLMGLLGTVISLIPMVGTMETALFFAALTSTFWGIVFAIIFKALNGFLQAKVEQGNQQVNTYLLRLDARQARELGDIKNV
ncbi:MotA/TolQ/ExbB proton channel family protein [Fundicoccus culcitae]|uniref:MotA/TolQ/ExbB proton channel family protein n=1 Tax=Fundicoccus culcitae TaxID=2969821 RepID=A0ABY5P6Y5_9LACT|nr:MotA/TolQ/ExbB proton channel family protein [Fundicoccus culcitae]UUX34502.1 MotA/TolQ/ExbB proton channel family protein [Fundicoccus culcitae]